MRRVIWPGALPSILAGFRITASVALLLVVSAEMIGAQFGIGAFVLQAGNLMQTDQLLAGVVILSRVRAGGGQADQPAGGEAAALAVRQSSSRRSRAVRVIFDKRGRRMRHRDRDASSASPDDGW